MKMVEAIVKPFKLDEVKEALTKAGIQGMMHLRKKIEISDAPHRLLKTESGIGYRLVMPSSTP